MPLLQAIKTKQLAMTRASGIGYAVSPAVAKPLGVIPEGRCLWDGLWPIQVIARLLNSGELWASIVFFCLGLPNMHVCKTV